MPTTSEPVKPRGGARSRKRNHDGETIASAAAAAAAVTPGDVGAINPGLNDMADALEAMPMEIIRHFTLLREIDAKCIVTMPELTRLIKDLLEDEDIAEADKEKALAQIRQLIRELMPCLEEKMHVAGVAADAIARHVERLDMDFNDYIVGKDEIPHLVRFGPKEHIAYLPIITPAEAKLQQSTRSESRREAIAAKKAAKEAAETGKKDNTKPEPSDKPTQSKTSTNGGRGSNGNSKLANGKSGGSNGNTSSSSKRKKAVSSTPADIPEPNSTQESSSAALHQSTSAGSDDVKTEFSEESNEIVNSSKRRNPNNQRATSSRSRKPASAKSTTAPSRKKVAKSEDFEEEEEPEEHNEEQLYCYCQQVSFGEMVGCDGPDCKIEWFHLPCIGLTQSPVGQWFCEDCAKKNSSK